MTSGTGLGRLKLNVHFWEVVDRDPYEGRSITVTR